MQRETEKLLRDILDAAMFILEHTSSVDFDHYASQRLLRDAVERNFITIGEAMNQLRKVDPDIADAIAEHPQIISFRHMIVHAYDSIDSAVVWTIIRDHLPKLKDDTQRLLDASV